MRLLSMESPDYHALKSSAGLLDLSARSRICLVGADREKFLHGQITNDLLRVAAGQGIYAALVNAKGRIESDLYIFKLQDELLLDFEPGLTGVVSERLARYVIAEDVQIVDVANVYQLLALHGPEAGAVLRKAFSIDPPNDPLSWSKLGWAGAEIYIARNDRFGELSYNIYMPNEQKSAAQGALCESGAVPASLEAAETIRIENGVPRFGADMDSRNLAPETGIQKRAISYAKGCYIGQEVIARIRTYGQVAKALRLLRIEGEELPRPGAKITAGGQEAGYLGSSTISPRWKSIVALGYVRKEHFGIGKILELPDLGVAAEVIAAPGEV